MLLGLVRESTGEIQYLAREKLFQIIILLVVMDFLVSLLSVLPLERIPNLILPQAFEHKQLTLPVLPIRFVQKIILGMGRIGHF